MSAAPKKILDEIAAEVCKLADSHKYMLKTRLENSKFMDGLAQHPKVGVRLKEYQRPEEIRLWIKDVALHNYSAKKRAAPRDIDDLLKTVANDSIEELDYDAENKLSVHRSSKGELFIVARGTHVKWETALRKLLLFRAKREKPAKSQYRMILYIHLIDGDVVNAGDRRLVEDALKLISVTTIWR